MNKIYLKVCAILCILFVSSCTVENSLVEMNEEKTFTLEQARANFENNAEDLKLVSFLKPQNLDKARTKSDGETDWENIVPDWDNAVFGQKESSVAYMIPITLPGNLKAKLNLSFGRYRTYYHKDETVKSYLVVEKRHDGTVKRFITTSIGDSGNRTSSEKPYLYTGSRRHFNGLFMISSESGEAKLAYYYVNGRRYKMHISKENSTHSHINSPNNRGSIGFIFRGSKPMTKGGDGGNSTGEDDMAYCYTCHQTTQWVMGTINGVERLVCSLCGLPAEEIGGGELYFFCSVCGNLESNCTCGNNNPGPYLDPDLDPDEDQCCPVCGFFWEHCNCYHEGGTGGGSGNNNGNQNGDGQGISSDLFNFKAYTPKSGDQLVNNVQYTHTQQSEQSSCSFNALSYIFNVLGYNYSESDVVIMYKNYLMTEYGYDQNTADNMLDLFMSLGVYDSWFMDMLSAFVNYNIYNSPISSIDQGRMVLATMNGANNQGDGHCIVIVGYDAYHDYIFYDPASGCLKQEDITSPITFVKYYTILSKKE